VCIIFRAAWWIKCQLNCLVNNEPSIWRDKVWNWRWNSLQILIFLDFISCILLYIVTCSVLRATKMTGSSLDHWICWHFGYTLFLNYDYYGAIALSTLYNSLLHTHSKYYTWIKSSNHTSNLHRPTFTLLQLRTSHGCLLPRTDWLVASFVFKINPFHGPHRKHRLPLSWMHVCSVAIAFLQLRAHAWRGQHRKHSFPSIVACILVYRAVAWQRVDQIRYSMLNCYWYINSLHNIHRWHISKN
jgi:hypothetical protein